MKYTSFPKSTTNVKSRQMREGLCRVQSLSGNKLNELDNLPRWEGKMQSPEFRFRHSGTA